MSRVEESRGFANGESEATTPTPRTKLKGIWDPLGILSFSPIKIPLLTLLRISDQLRWVEAVCHELKSLEALQTAKARLESSREAWSPSPPVTPYTGNKKNNSHASDQIERDLGSPRDPVLGGSCMSRVEESRGFANGESEAGKLSRGLVSGGGPGHH
jgi:hypothetical protein